MIGSGCAVERCPRYRAGTLQGLLVFLEILGGSRRSFGMRSWRKEKREKLLCLKLEYTVDENAVTEEDKIRLRMIRLDQES